MDLYEAAMQVSLQENPLTPEAAGKLSIMTLERHASVSEVLPRGGARVAHRRFDTEGPLQERGPMPALKQPQEMGKPQKKGSQRR